MFIDMLLPRLRIGELLEPGFRIECRIEDAKGALSRRSKGFAKFERIE